MKIICFGDSLTTCGGENGRFSDILQDRFPGHLFLNRGIGGESFVEALVRFETDVLAEQPDIVLLCYDISDATAPGKPVALVGRLAERSLLMGALLIVCGPPDDLAAQSVPWIDPAFALKNNPTPNVTGMAAMAPAILGVLKQVRDALSN